MTECLHPLPLFLSDRRRGTGGGAATPDGEGTASGVRKECGQYVQSCRSMIDGPAPTPIHQPNTTHEQTATTPHKGAPAPAAVTPTPTTNGGSGSPLRRRGRTGTEAAGGNGATVSQQQKAVTAGAGGLNVRLVLVVLAVVALVARLSVPALKELRAVSQSSRLIREFTIHYCLRALG